MKRLRPFQIPTKEDVLPSLETPSQGHLGTASGPYHHHSFPQLSESHARFVRDRDGLDVLQTLQATSARGSYRTTKPDIAFARPETFCLLHTSLHNPPPTGRTHAIPAAKVLEARVQAALGRVAKLVVEDPTFIPVFERLEQELADIQSQNEAVERARKYLTAPT